jgi:hypothetical protein
VDFSISVVGFSLFRLSSNPLSKGGEKKGRKKKRPEPGKRKNDPGGSAMFGR